MVTIDLHDLIAYCVMLQVWLCFLASTAFFIAFMSVVAVKERNKTGRSIMFRDEIRSRSTWATVYTQFEYVLTIITTQGTVYPSCFNC